MTTSRWFILTQDAVGNYERPDWANVRLELEQWYDHEGRPGIQPDDPHGHPGYDGGVGEKLYEFKDFGNALYEYEVTELHGEQINAYPVYGSDTTPVATEESEEDVTATIDLPEGYSIDNLAKEGDATAHLIVLLNGEPIDLPRGEIPGAWHMDLEGAVEDAWGHYYGEKAARINEKLSEPWQIQAWRLRTTGDTYSPDHLTFRVDDGDLERITIQEHQEEICDLCCAHCGAVAADLEILDAYFGDEEEEDEEEYVEGSVAKDTDEEDEDEDELEEDEDEDELEEDEDEDELEEGEEGWIAEEE